MGEIIEGAYERISTFRWRFGDKEI